MKFNDNPNREAYLANLNECFGSWGNQETFQWVFGEAVGSLAPDLFTIEDEGADIAGSALTYRKLRIPGKEDAGMGVMTGSWTLPASRGKGCFTEIIRYSKKKIQERKVDYLTAFVTDTNASSRRLISEGSVLLPTKYVLSQPDGFPVTDPAEVVFMETSEENIGKIFNRRVEKLKNKIHYVYDLASFRHQFLERQGQGVFLAQSQGEFLILEKTETSFRILFSTDDSPVFLSSIAAWAHLQQRNVFFLTTSADAGFSEASGFKIIPGYFTIMACGDKPEEDLLSVRFDIQYGDKM